MHMVDALGGRVAGEFDDCAIGTDDIAVARFAKLTLSKTGSSARFRALPVDRCIPT
jgi:hypothetical protein